MPARGGSLNAASRHACTQDASWLTRERGQKVQDTMSSRAANNGVTGTTGGWLCVQADSMQAGCKLPAAAAAPVAEHTCGQGADWRRALAGW